MQQDPGLPRHLEREKLLYFVMLRQMEEPSEAVREAYQRLADAAAEAVGWDPRTLLLDWLESELRALRQRGEHQSSVGSQLMKAAVALSHALVQ